MEIRRRATKRWDDKEVKLRITLKGLNRNQSNLSFTARKHRVSIRLFLVIFSQSNNVEVFFFCWLSIWLIVITSRVVDWSFVQIQLRTLIELALLDSHHSGLQSVSLFSRKLLIKGSYWMDKSQRQGEREVARSEGHWTEHWLEMCVSQWTTRVDCWRERKWDNETKVNWP